MVRRGRSAEVTGEAWWTLLFLHSHSSSAAACMPLSPVPCGFVDLHLISASLFHHGACARSYSPCPLCSARLSRCPWLCRTDAETVYSLLLLGPLLGLKKQIFQRRLVLVSQSTSGKQQAVRGGLLGLETGHALICPAAEFGTSWRAQARGSQGRAP